MSETIKRALRSIVPARLRSRLKAAVRGLAYFGWRHRCPLCDSRLRTLLPYGFGFPVFAEKSVIGGGLRAKAVCPVCESLDRERLMYLFLRHRTDLFTTPTKLLHVAPERILRRALESMPDLDYLTADFAAPDVTVKMDITDIRYPDGAFDAIICNHVLEHVIDDRRAMAELFRVLRPGGWAILQVPMSLTLKSTYEDFSIRSPEGREQAFGQNDHVRIYAADYRDRLAEAGFEVEVFDWASDPDRFGGPSNVFALCRDEYVYFARRGD